MALRVIDLNEHNCSVNFKALDVDAVIFKIGYRGYADEGRIITDSRFSYFLEDCKRNNIPVGVYFDSQATSVREAKEEAKYILKRISGNMLNLPIYISLRYPERNGICFGRLYKAQLSKEKQTRIAKAFCDTVIDNGYKAGVCADFDFFKKRLNVTALNDYSLWVIHYSAYGLPALAGVTFDMWQYTDDAEVKGVIGMVNADCLFNEEILK